MTKKKKLSYRIRHELDLALASYASAKGQTRTDIITSIIEKYLSCDSFAEYLKKVHSQEITIERKDWINWKKKGDYLTSSHHSKIKFIAATTRISISEVMDNILDSYLSKINPAETFEETLNNVFS